MFAQKFNSVVQPVLNFGKKYAMFILAFIIGAIIIFPSLYFHYFEKEYRGIEFFGSDGEELYLSQIQEMYDGHYSLGNIYLSDLKNSPYVQQPLSPFLVMVFGKLFGVSAPIINIITKFLFPFLLSILVYFFFYNLLNKRQGMAIVLTTFVMLGPATVNFLNPGAWLAFIKQGAFVNADLQFLSYSRPINPQVSSFFFFGYLALLWKVLFVESKKVYIWLSALALGLSFYTYFFTFSLLFVFNGVLGIYFLFKKNWPQFKKLILITVGGLVVGIPFFINFFQVLKSPWFTETSYRLGSKAGHSFVFSRVWWGVTLATLILYRKWDNFKIFTLSFLAAAFIVTNQQLLTGRVAPIPSHYHWYYIAPLGGVILLYLIFLQLEKFISRRILSWCFVFLLALFFLAAIMFQRESYFVQRDTFVSKQQYAPIISWISSNLPKGSVVFGNRDVYLLVPAYTDKNVYYHGGEGDYLVDENRLRHSLFVYLYLNGITKDEIRAYVGNNRDNVGVWLFSQKYRVSNGCYGCFPDSVIDTLVSEYEDFLKLDFISELKKYQLDYVVWDKEKDPAWKMDRFFQQVVYAEEPIVIYRANP